MTEPKPKEFSLLPYLEWMIALQKTRIETLHRKERGAAGQYEPKVKDEMLYMTFLMKAYQQVSAGLDMPSLDRSMNIDPKIRKAAEKKIRDIMVTTGEIPT